MSGTRPAQRLIWHLPVYFALLSVYFLFQYDPSLYAHHHRVMFLVGNAYLQEFLTYPGGLVEWVTQFFFQFFRFRLPGSLMLAALSLAILVLTYRLFRELLGVQSPLLLASLPLLLFLVQQSHYGFPLLIGVKYSCSLACLLLYTRLRGRPRKAGVLLSALVYFALGGWCLLFVCLLCVIYETLYARDPRRYVLAGLNVLAYVALPFLAARFLFLISLSEAYFYIVPYELYQYPYLFHPDLPFYLFFLSLPLILLLHPCYGRLIQGRASVRRLLAGKGGLVTQSVLAILAGSAILMLRFDADEKGTIQVERLATQGRWSELLAVSRKMTQRTRQTVFHTNRALYHTGNLLGGLFTFPQIYGADGLFLTRPGIGGQIAMPASDLYLELGHVKASQVMAYEGQTRQKYDPRILERLAVTNIITEDFSAARLFLGILDRSLLHRRWVRRWRDVLSDGEGAASDDLVKSKRAQMSRADFFISTGQPNKDLVKLVTENPSNRMAQEYLLAYYLLECRLGDVVACLKAVPWGGAAMPRYLEEALVLTQAAAPEALAGTAFRISPSTVQRFRRFNQTYGQHSVPGNAAAAQQALYAGFGDTFWYYAKYTDPRQSRTQLKSRRIGVHVF